MICRAEKEKSLNWVPSSKQNASVGRQGRFLPMHFPQTLPLVLRHNSISGLETGWEREEWKTLIPNHIQWFIDEWVSRLHDSLIIHFD